MKCKMIKKLTAIGLAFVTVFTFIPALGEGNLHIGMENVYAFEDENLAINFPFFVGNDTAFNDTIYTDGTRNLQYTINEPDMDEDSISFSIGIWNDETNDWDILLEEGEHFSVNRQEQYVTFDGEKIASVIRFEEESVTLDVLVHILDQNKKEHTKWLDLDLDKPVDDADEDMFYQSTTRLLGQECWINYTTGLRYIRNNHDPEGKNICYEITDYSIEQIPAEGNEGDVVAVSEGDDSFKFKSIGVGKAVVSITYTCTDDTYYVGEEIKSTYEITVIPKQYSMHVIWSKGLDVFYMGESTSLSAEGYVEYGESGDSTEGFSFQWSLDAEGERYLSLTVDPKDSSKAFLTYDKEPDSELESGESQDCDANLTVQMLHNNEVVLERTHVIQICRLPIKSLRKAEIIIEGEPLPYTAEQICPSFHVVYDGVTLKEGEDYEFWYGENINTGSGTVGIEGRGNYAAQVEKFFEIGTGPNSPPGRWSTYKGIRCWLDRGGDVMPNVWRKDGNEWYYMDDVGLVTMNAWAKDRNGWCWLGDDGKITRSKWILYEDEWYYLKADGYMAANEWAKDSGGWYYMNSAGRIAKNAWAKDRNGWCWLGDDGRITKGKWIWSGSYWYYLKADGYMAANEWAKDSGGWMWMDGSGRIAENVWAKDSKGWMYMDADGRITKNKWVKSGGYWYYLKSNGYMATGTQKIGGKTYKFDSAGRWIS